MHLPGPSRAAHLLLSLLFLLSAAACGQRGPLYLPQEQAPPEHQEAPATEPTNTDDSAEHDPA